MTITPQYTWRQTSSKLILLIDLHSNSYKAVDLVSTSSYLKVSFSPYYLEVFLLHPVTASDTITRHRNGKLELVLAKVKDVEWPVLASQHQSRADAAAERGRALEEQQTQQQPKRGGSVERACVSSQLQLDAAEQAAQLRLQQQEVSDYFRLDDEDKEDDDAENNTATETNTAADNIISQGSTTAKSSTAAKSNTTAQNNITSQGNMTAEVSGREGRRCSTESSEDRSLAERRRVSEEREYDGDGEDHYSSSGEDRLSVGEQQQGGSVRRVRLTKKSTAGRDRLQEEESAAAAHRSTAKKSSRSSKGARVIEVTYSSRSDGLPARVSRDGHTFSHGDEDGGGATVVNTGDCDVEALVERANALFLQGLYSECCAAYGEVISVVPDCVRAYSNRAAAHLANRDPHQALYDTNKALSLLDSCPTSSTRQSRLLCLSRRGAAHAALGQLSRALTDYEAALAVQPDSPQLLTDVANIRRALDTSEGSSWVGSEEEEGHL